MIIDNEYEMHRLSEDEKEEDKIFIQIKEEKLDQPKESREKDEHQKKEIKEKQLENIQIEIDIPPNPISERKESRTDREKRKKKDKSPHKKHKESSSKKIDQIKSTSDFKSQSDKRKKVSSKRIHNESDEMQSHSEMLAHPSHKRKSLEYLDLHSGKFSFSFSL